jgi:hypothetical protein
MPANSKQPGPLQIVDAILNYPHLSHSPPSDDPALEEAKYQSSFHKFLRFAGARNLRHEMQECLVSLNPNTVRDQLATVFGGVTRVALEPTVSGGFGQAYLKFGIQARRAARVTEELPVPLVFACLKAFASGETGPELRVFERDTRAGDGSQADRPFEKQSASPSVSKHVPASTESASPEVREAPSGLPRRRRTKAKSSHITMNIGQVSGQVIGKQIIKGGQTNIFGG